ncbi:hypothetical protein NUU61_002942 [Penicillium alfredii]|uniref:Uncharacterized protein n=1 Tax=Penicillium alfredii TaxID=1506179 RepID=A0A9W9FSI0_9EURO|nr:uncharacterized protein NUU61_002942 [Penicillium alfredii]KAJ5105595.1 hypothetical protein NUU61_002942 [Penicillium alfredii]
MKYIGLAMGLLSSALALPHSAPPLPLETSSDLPSSLLSGWPTPTGPLPSDPLPTSNGVEKRRLDSTTSDTDTSDNPDESNASIATTVTVGPPDAVKKRQFSSTLPTDLPLSLPFEIIPPISSGIARPSSTFQKRQLDESSITVGLGIIQTDAPEKRQVLDLSDLPVSTPLV